MNIVIHKRIKKRHPDISNTEILEALENTLNWIQRSKHNGEIFGIGITKQGRFLEYVYMEYKEAILVYHAQLATKNAFKELGLADRRRNEDR